MATPSSAPVVLRDPWVRDVVMLVLAGALAVAGGVVLWTAVAPRPHLASVALELRHHATGERVELACTNLVRTSPGLARCIDASGMAATIGVAEAPDATAGVLRARIDSGQPRLVVESPRERRRDIALAIVGLAALPIAIGLLVVRRRRRRRIKAAS